MTGYLLSAAMLLAAPASARSGDYLPTTLGAHWEYAEYYSNKAPRRDMRAVPRAGSAPFPEAPRKTNLIGFEEVDIVFSGMLRRKNIIIRQHKTFKVQAGSPAPKKVPMLIANAEDILIRSKNSVESVATYSFKPQASSIAEGSREFKDVLNELSDARSYFLNEYRKTGEWPFAETAAAAPAPRAGSTPFPAAPSTSTLEVSTGTLVDSPKPDSDVVSISYHIKRKKQDEEHQIELNRAREVLVRYPVKPKQQWKNGNSTMTVAPRKKFKSELSSKSFDCSMIIDADSREARCLSPGVGEVVISRPAEDPNWETRTKELLDVVIP